MADLKAIKRSKPLTICGFERSADLQLAFDTLAESTDKKGFKIARDLLLKCAAKEEPEALFELALAYKTGGWCLSVNRMLEHEYLSKSADKDFPLAMIHIDFDSIERPASIDLIDKAKRYVQSIRTEISFISSYCKFYKAFEQKQNLTGVLEEIEIEEIRKMANLGYVYAQSILHASFGFRHKNPNWSEITRHAFSNNTPFIFNWIIRYVREMGGFGPDGPIVKRAAELQISIGLFLMGSNYKFYDKYRLEAKYLVESNCQLERTIQSLFREDQVWIEERLAALYIYGRALHFGRFSDRQMTSRSKIVVRRIYDRTMDRVKKAIFTFIMCFKRSEVLSKDTTGLIARMIFKSRKWPHLWGLTASDIEG